MEELNAIELKKVQAVDLEMAKFFVEYCNKKGLLSYFCGGGCLGAIRHKGFIPWDDDLDFFMPRDDYEKLKREWNDTERYSLRYPTSEYNDHCMFTTLRDKHTTMIKDNQVDLDIVHGVTIDIFPLDGCPKGKVRRSVQLFWALTYEIFCAQQVPVNHGKKIKVLGSVILNVFKSKKRRYQIWRFAERQMTKYPFNQSNFVSEFCAGPGIMKRKYPMEWFREAVMVDFEDAKMPIPIGYDGYLRMAFGDYMQLPPEEKRVSPHECFIDVDRPYTVYKGKKYCIR